VIVYKKKSYRAYRKIWFIKFQGHVRSKASDGYIKYDNDAQALNLRTVYKFIYTFNKLQLKVTITITLEFVELVLG
jgi:hypothetical protein